MMLTTALLRHLTMHMTTALVFFLMLSTRTTTTTAFVVVPTTAASSSSSTTTTAPQRRQTSSSLFSLRRMEGESEKDFFKRITQAAHDPKAFENLALEKDDLTSSVTTSKKKIDHRHHYSANQPQVDEKKKKKGYVPVEVWDAEQKERRANGELTWEERVQFDGQQHGNKFNQNEILRHHLNAF